MERDPDAVKARRLADILTQHAEKLEQTDEALAAEIDPTRFDPLKQAQEVKAGARRLIRRLHDCWRKLDQKNVTELDNARRSQLIEGCRHFGAVLRELRKTGNVEPHLQDDLLDMWIRLYADDVPEHADLLQQNAELVNRLVLAYADNVGGKAKQSESKVEELTEQLCRAMGYGAEWASIKRGMKRYRKI